MIYKKAFQEVKKEVQDIIFFKHKKKNPIYIKTGIQKEIITSKKKKLENVGFIHVKMIQSTFI